MTTLSWETYNDGPGWNDLGSNRLGFSGDATDHAASVSAGTWQDGTHVVSGTPGSDQCGDNHANNVKFISETQMQVNGGATETINDTNLADNECTFRLHFNDATSYALQAIKIYTYDGDDIANPAVGVDAAIYVKGESTAWTTLNSDSTDGPSDLLFDTAGVGGEGDAFEVDDRATAFDHYIYCALSVSPETSGGKSSFALGAYMEYY